jgi:hypothetical protein
VAGLAGAVHPGLLEGKAHPMGGAGRHHPPLRPEIQAQQDEAAPRAHLLLRLRLPGQRTVRRHAHEDHRNRTHQAPDDVAAPTAAAGRERTARQRGVDREIKPGIQDSRQIVDLLHADHVLLREAPLQKHGERSR